MPSRADLRFGRSEASAFFIYTQFYGLCDVHVIAISYDLIRVYIVY